MRLKLKVSVRVIETIGCFMETLRYEIQNGESFYPTQLRPTVTKCEKAVELSDFRSDGGMQEESKKAAERIQMSKNSPD